jgi:hypothetical protein
MPDGKYALIVATSRYTDPRLTKLEAPARDAASLATVLSMPTIGGFEVKSVVDAPAPKVMQEIEAFFDGRRRDDLVLLYFSGHGILDEGARLYFATTDTRIDRPRSTAVPASFVNELMNESRSRRQVLMLDCCNSGAFARGAKAGGNIGTGERFEGRGKVVITASDALQYAFEGQDVEGEGVRSVFTQVLVDGLRSGEADLDRDGLVALDELYDYVYGRVVDESPRQRPRKWAFDVEGQLVIARAADGAAKPAVEPSATRRPDAKRAPLRRARPSLGRKRLLALVGGLVLVGTAIGLAVALLGNSSGSGPSESPQALAPGRDLMLKAAEAWESGKLATLSPRLISVSARSALMKMPTDPITPVPPALDECSGNADDVSCSFTYPGRDLFLSFEALRYGSGLRLADVRCYHSSTGDVYTDGFATCSKLVRNS